MFHHIYHEMFNFFVRYVIECKIANIGVNLLGRENFPFISFSSISMNSVFISGPKLDLLCSWLEPSLYEQVMVGEISWTGLSLLLIKRYQRLGKSRYQN